MTAFRRTGWNFSLQRAIEWSRNLNKPLVVFEPLRCGYRWASDRLHQFVIQGMADNARRLAGKPVVYYPYLEPDAGAGRGLLAALAERACVVVGDDFPCFFLPRMVDAAREQIACRFELVDSNGMLPLRAAEKTFLRAVDFRRFLQKNAERFLHEFPEPDAFSGLRLPKLDKLPTEITRRWAPANVQALADDTGGLSAFPIDHQIQGAGTRGGALPPNRRCESSLSTNFRATLSAGTSRRKTSRADFHPICTSATFQRIRSFQKPCSVIVGRRGAFTRKLLEAPVAGGAPAKKWNPFGTS